MVPRGGHPPCILNGSSCPHTGPNGGHRRSAEMGGERSFARIHQSERVDAAINPAARLNASLPPPVRWITILMRIANGVLNNEEPRYGEDLTMPSGTTPSNLVFTLAPFGDPFDQYYEEIIKPAVESAKMRALRADEIYGTRHIINDIWQRLMTLLPVRSTCCS